MGTCTEFRLRSTTAKSKYWVLGTCTEFRHFGYAQCIATLNYRVRVASRREVVGAASPRVVLGIG
ncbi:MAG: hypothetical protein V7K50_10995 [Nostoc sp.]|uniref:hypothetical protein n=1 Tax=Nostoc sp. TaxID=1180 RepID=UPI002FF6DF0B